MRRARRVDTVDKGIIEALQAKRPRALPAHRRHARRLGGDDPRPLRDGCATDNILQVTGVTNPLGLGFEAQAMVGIRTAGPPENDRRRDRPLGARRTTSSSPPGQFDVLVELVCADRRALLDVTNRIRALPDVITTESFLYLELWKQLYDWGARVHEDARRGGVMTIDPGRAA